MHAWRCIAQLGPEAKSQPATSRRQAHTGLRPMTASCCAQARDPIPTFRKWALEQGLLSEGKVKEIEAAVTAEVEDSVKFADESPKPVSVTAPLDLYQPVALQCVRRRDRDQQSA